MHGKRRSAVAVASALLGSTALLVAHPGSAGNPWGANYFPNVTLITQDGRAVRFYDDLLKGKAVAIKAWLTRYLAEPDRMRAEGDPIATALFAKYNNLPMPNLRLSSIDVDALLLYLETHGTATREKEN